MAKVTVLELGPVLLFIDGVDFVGSSGAPLGGGGLGDGGGGRRVDVAK